jgi:hypothetical protein
MKPVLITWGFNPHNGEIYFDAYLELNNPENASLVSMVYIRAEFQKVNVSLLHIPEDASRKDIEEYVTSSTGKDEVVQKLNDAKVRKDEVIRKKLATNAIDFLAGGV